MLEQPSLHISLLMEQTLYSLEPLFAMCYWCASQARAILLPPDKFTFCLVYLLVYLCGSALSPAQIWAATVSLLGDEPRVVLHIVRLLFYAS